MIAPATQPAPMMTAIPPPTPSASACPLRPSIPACQSDAQRVDRQRDEDDPEHGATGRQERDLIRVADGDRVEREEQRPDEGHSEEDDARRDAAASSRSCRRSEGLVIHRHVIRQSRPFHRGRHLRPDTPNAASRNARPLVDRLERPEAVDDPDLEPAPQVRAVAPAQEPVVGQVTAEPRDVVAAVVVEDEQAAARVAGHGPLRACSVRDRR